MKTFNCPHCCKAVPCSYIKERMAFQSRRNIDVKNFVNYEIPCLHCGDKFRFWVEEQIKYNCPEKPSEPNG